MGEKIGGKKRKKIINIIFLGQLIFSFIIEKKRGLQILSLYIFIISFRYICFLNIV